MLTELCKLGASAIDADQIAHQVIAPGQPAYDEVLTSFGSSILGDNQNIDRKKLGKIVFSDPASREKLNQIVHPHVFEEEERQKADLEAQAGSLSSPILVVDAALMIEAGSYRRYRVVVVVYCQPAVQIQRLMARDRISREEALERIQSQMPILEKIRYGDYLIENSGTLADTRDQVKQVFSELLNLYEEEEG